MFLFLPDKITCSAAAIFMAAAICVENPSHGKFATEALGMTGPGDIEKAEPVAALSPPKVYLPRTVSGFRMIELFLIACRDENCREVSLLYDAYEISLMTCMVMGQHEAARWQSAHPGWRIRRWSCRFAGTSDKSV